MSLCDTVFFLDYSTDVCLDGIKQRKGKPRSDMPWIETDDDEEFLQFVRDYNMNSRPKVIELINSNPQKNIVIFKSRKEADVYLNNIR